MSRALGLVIVVLVLGMSAGSSTTEAKQPVKHKPSAQRSRHRDAVKKKPTPLPLKEALVGKWHQIGGKDHLEFGKDGAFRAANDESTLLGKYVLRDDGTMAVELALPVSGGPILRKVVIDHDELTLTDVRSGMVIKYRRAK